MINLAGVAGCNEDIAQELKAAGITLVRHSEPIKNSEVPASVTGKLDSFSFRRDWYYWVVSGKVPLSVAEELFAHHDGVRDVRVAGHCGCPPPAEWVSYFDEAGIELFASAQIEGMDKGSTLLELTMEDESLRFVDDPSSEGKPFITHYHIDTQAGLNLFAETIKRHNLV